MADDNGDRESVAEEGAEKLARRAVWGCVLGAIAMALVVCAKVMPWILMLHRDRPYVRGNFTLFLWIIATVVLLGLVGGTMAALVSAPAVRQANTINRPIGLLGLILGILAAVLAATALLGSLAPFLFALV